MNTLNLIYPNQSDIKFTTIIFPDGQQHIKIDVATAALLSKKEPLQIFSKGCKLEQIDEIYTTNSYKEFSGTRENFTVFPISKYL